MRSGLFIGLIVFSASTGLPAKADFIATLPPAEVKRLGLDKLTPEERAAIDAAVEQYCRTHEVKATKQAAAAAVDEYKKTQEPVAIARAVDVVKQRAEEDKIVRFRSRVLGRFSGWGGKTFFPLENGQLWQQVGSEVYYFNPVDNLEVEFRKSQSGYFRLYLEDGTWVTVRRVR